MMPTPQQLANLARVITPLDTPDRRAVYPSIADYRWHLFHAGNGKDALTLPGMEDSGDVSARVGHLNDAHIYTMLARIIPDETTQ